MEETQSTKGGKADKGTPKGAASAAKSAEPAVQHEVGGEETLAGVGVTYDDESQFSSIDTATDFFYKPEVERDSGEYITLRGIPMARKQRPKELGKDPQYYLVLKLTRPMAAFDSEGEIHNVPAGELVWVDERAQTKLVSACLPRLDERGRASAFEVIVTPKHKKSIGKGKTMWSFKSQSRQLNGDEVRKWGVQALAELFTRVIDTGDVRQLGAGASEAEAD